MTRPALHSALLIGAALGAIAAIPAKAQTAADPAGATSAPSQAASATADAGASTGEITVTARRKEERLQDVPVSISALSPSLIRSQNVVGPDDIARLAPGVAANTQGAIRNGATYTIRGQGAGSLGGELAVISYFDDVATSAPGPGFLFDVAGVDVLKGPQGTLFGRNTTGGAVLIRPQTPTNTFEGYADLSLGNYAYKRFQGALNVPIVDDKVLLRVATDIYRRNGYTKDINTGRDYDDRNYNAFRATLLVKMTDRLENKTLVNFSYAYGNQSGSSVLNDNPNSFINLLYPGFATAVAQQQTLGPRHVAYDYQDGRSIFRAMAVNNVTTWKVTDNATLKNILGYRDTRVINADDTDGTIVPLLSYVHDGWQSFPFPDPPQKTISDEVQLSGTTLDKRLDYTTGFYFESRNPATDSQHDISTAFGTATYNQALKYDRSYGVYAQLTYAILDQLKFTAGGRYTWDQRHQVSTNYPLTSPCTATFTPAGGYCDLDERANFKAPTYTLNLQYQPKRDLMFYAASRRGYKSGGFNALAAAGDLASFKPEYVTDYEVGTKSVFHLSDATVRLNLAAYRSNFKNRQVAELILLNGTFTQATVNAGKGYVQGVEYDGSVTLWSRLQLSTGFAYTDGKFTNLMIGGVDFSHQPIPNVSKYSYNVAGDLTLVKSDSLGDISVNANWSWHSDFAIALNVSGPTTNPAGRLTPSYGQLNLRLDWQHFLGTKFDLGVFATNALNTTKIISLSDTYDLVGYTSVNYNEPRMVGVDLKYSF